MIDALKKQFRIMGVEVLWCPAIIFGVGILGQILHYIISSTVKENTTCFALGTVFAVMMFTIMVLITSGMGVSSYFNVEISMGNTRKQFFWTYYIFYVIYYLAAVVMVILLNIIENHAMTVLYPALENEINFLPYLMKFGIPAAVVMPIISIFFGMLVMKFGVKAFWALWALWMFGCLGIPRIVDAVGEAPNSLFGKMGNWVGNILVNIPVGAWIVMVAVAYIACLAGSWTMIRKQQVTM